MLVEPFWKVYQKIGKFFLPLLFLLFFICSFLVIFTSVRTKSIHYYEGQVVEESIRANKTIENTEATKKRRQIAAEAVTPEYTFQEDIAKQQYQYVNRLFELVKKVEKNAQEKYQEALDNQKADDVAPSISVTDEIVDLKKQFESLDADSLTFYQNFDDTFYKELFSISSEELNEIQSLSLKYIDQEFKKQIKEADVTAILKELNQQVNELKTTETSKNLVKTILSKAIVPNSFLNEKKTEQLRQKARDDVQPVMIYQGEIIVREGSQIDAAAMEKLKLLGLTNQRGSIFPMVALILAIVLQLIVLYSITRQEKDLKRRIIKIVFYLLMMFVSIVVMKTIQVIQDESISYLSLLYPAMFTPFAVNILLERRLAIVAALFQVILVNFIFYDAIGTSVVTIIVIAYLFAGLMGTLMKRHNLYNQRLQAMLLALGFPFFMNVIVVIMQGMSFSDTKTYLTLICGFIGNVISLLLMVGLFPYIELLVSDDSMIVLNELSNPNHPLLKQLLEEAPGTYHHSMMVANLSANAVAAINGRSLLTRVACYYHDIGKLKHANFFVENLPHGAENPHNFLLPEDSKQIIFGHVIDGAKILEQYHMPQMVIDICNQHHGTTLMKFFYVKAKERDPQTKESDYRYPGPKPQTKEAAVVSIADSCEAAVRAMDHPSNEKIQKFVHQLIESRILDGQLNESGVTLNELAIIEKSIVNGLCSTFHSRIKYPKMESEAKSMKEEQERREN
ncbi:HD family phosphohydrolase [Enterococcus cecorum]|uniref:HDIG domain-containing protein n=3 Tax=Enterococcus cecorum TaxID=44008 RepID=A0AAP6IQ66_9ENTE|nr:HDIG domain-containing metalloprotein [Enterococcus cecorum]MCJ0566399.1 HDIG domain-containing protein [Enterococcus cecorum]MCJ0592195.1 HDIG domain-containing protein [Enterococcus cecorum]MCJ0595443.1 HDIG domain-containing protein [Enterococcus cecorum]MCJ0596824.1 HDIG domain-containing protein [Enterococcus cecorum]MDZ5504794.1 HDIG domain-containing protein [Enterococcus cecorum]